MSRIVIHNRTEEKIESLIEFDSIMSAEACKEAINGADVYAGCCTLDVKFSKVRVLNPIKCAQRGYPMVKNSELLQFGNPIHHKNHSSFFTILVLNIKCVPKAQFL